VEELRQVEAQLVAGPLAGPLGAENETQALRTLEAALLGLLLEARACPLAAGGDAAWEALGLEAAWRPSFDACVAFATGQQAILDRALLECRRLLGGAAVITGC
jgi:hypothetical protein